MTGNAEFQRWSRAEPRTTAQNVEIANIAKSRFARDTYGRRMTQLSQSLVTKSIFETTSDDAFNATRSSEEEYEERHSISSWKSRYYTSKQTIEGSSRGLERTEVSDRDSLSSQRPISGTRGAMVDDHEKVQTWLTSSNHKVPATHPGMETARLQTRNSVHLSRRMAMKHDDKNVLTPIQRLDSTMSGSTSCSMHESRNSAPCSRTNPRSTYRSASFTTNAKAPTVSPPWAEVAGENIPKVIPRARKPLPTVMESENTLLESSGAAVHSPPPWQESVRFREGLRQMHLAQLRDVRPGPLCVDQDLPRVARTFSQMGITRASKTGMMKGSCSSARESHGSVPWGAKVARKW